MTAAPAREIQWGFLLLVLVCASIMAAGFFFAARQHFTSMEFGIKNSKLRDQLKDLEAEKRRLLLAREVSLSPLAIRKAARGLGLDAPAQTAPVLASATKPATEPVVTAEAKPVKVELKDPKAPAVIRTVMTTTSPAKTNGETRGRIVETREKKDRTEVAALMQLR